jgi:D-serine deaminase-like pyridoxal phosphate-dependent protein
MPMNELPTPAALIDEARLMHNVHHMQQRLHTLGVRLRPHVKTAKCLAVAERQRAAGAVGITVSTLKEAEVFFEAGERDILYAVGIAPANWAARSLRERGCALTWWWTRWPPRRPWWRTAGPTDTALP